MFLSFINNKILSFKSLISFAFTIIPDLDKELYFPSDRKYDILNDFENTGVDWCVVDKEFVNEHVMNGDVALRLSTTKADQCVVLKL